MNCLIFLGIVVLINGSPLPFEINAKLTGKPLPVTRTFLNAAKNAVNPVKNAQFSVSGSLGDGQHKSVSHHIERSLSSSNLDSDFTTSRQTSFSLSKSTNLGSNIDSSSYQINSNLGSFSSNIEPNNLNANLGNHLNGEASFSLSKSLSSVGQSSGTSLLASQTTGVSSSSSTDEFQEHFASNLAKTNLASNIESNLAEKNLATNIESNLASTNLASSIESSLAKTNHATNIDSSLINRQQFENNAQSYSLNQNNIKSLSSNVESSNENYYKSNKNSLIKSVNEESLNYPIGVSNLANYASDSSIESEARSFNVKPESLDDLLRRQNSNAHYSFSTDIKDKINDLTQERVEVRDGSTVRGHYSYSDGNIRYIVYYVADENGYRVEKEETVKLEGPKINPYGTAEIDAKSNDIVIRYGVRSVPIENGTLII